MRSLCRISVHATGVRFAVGAPVLIGIIASARRYLGRPYDIHYEFDDEKIYCSELVYKAVATATGVRLGKTQRIGELNWRPFGAFIVSIEDPVPVGRALITPRALSEAPELTKVYETPP